MSESGGKGKLIFAIVLLVIAVGYAAWQFRGGETSLPNRVALICAKTGKIYKLDRNDVTRVPAKNPDTGEFSLIPLLDHDGEYSVDQRRAALLKEFPESVQFIDPQTLKVRSGMN